MKQHIDTIPLWDAYKAGGECPLCALYEKTELDYVDNFMGASVMEPDTRVEVNEKGYCTRHFGMMFANGNRLGLALMTDTYMRETIGKIKKAQSSKPKGGLFKKADPDADAIKPLTGTCILCDRLNATMDRYVYTLLYMYRHESEFKKAFDESKGVCLKHYAELRAAAPKHLSGKDLDSFLSSLDRIETENLERIEKELEWFTLKFDYRNKDKPWGNSQDAVERAINKLRGKCV